MRFLAIALLVTTMGCAAAMGYRPSCAEPMAALTTGNEGVCVYVDQVRSCLSTNQVGDPPDSFVETTLTSQNPEEANPRNWRIAVIRDEGETVLDQPLTSRGVGNRAVPIPLGVGGVVVASVTTAKALERVPPWRPGGYTLRYTYLPTERRIELSVRLR